MAAPPDYDAVRRRPGDDEIEAPAQLSDPRATVASDIGDMDDGDVWDALDLPGADLSTMNIDDLTGPVQPVRAGEFTCSRCFLVHHRSRAHLSRLEMSPALCHDCA